MIRNILFDLDDTIFDFGIAERTALSKTLVHLGIEPKAETLKRYSVLNAAQWKLLEKGEITRQQVKLRRYRLLFDELGVDCSPKYATEYYEKLLSEGHWFVEGAEKLLQEICDKYNLYIVSNGTAKVQHGRIAGSGIEKYFKRFFISEEMGFEKPNPEFFARCFAKIPNFKREETIIVGDSLTSDILGGKNAGIKTVWYNPRNMCPKEIQPDFEIERLSELLLLLKTL